MEKEKVGPSDYTEINAICHKETGKIFKSKEDYNVFLSRYLANRERILKEIELKRDWNTTINLPRLSATSIEDFIDKIKDLKKASDNLVGTKTNEITIKDCEFIIGLNSSRSIHPIAYTQKPDGSPFEPTFPAWRVSLLFKIDDSLQQKSCSSYEIFNPSKGSPDFIPGLTVISAISIPMGYTQAFKAIIFLDDLPAAKRIIYPKLQEYYSIKKEVELSNIKDQERIKERNLYAHQHDDPKEVLRKIEETNLIILKHTELLKNLKASHVSHIKDAAEEYDMKFPYDYNKTKVLMADLAAKDKELKNLK